MTNEERARKTTELLEKHFFWANESRHRDWFIEMFSVQLREACEEAVKNELQERMLNLCDSKAYDKGFEAAREKALQIVNKSVIRYAIQELADQIREMCYEKP